MSIVWISLWAAALLVLPGLVIWRLVGPRGMPVALQVAPAFALSLAVTAVVGWAGYALGLGFTSVRAVSVLLVLLATLGLPFALWYRRPGAVETVLTRWVLWVVSAMAVAAGFTAAYSGPWLSATADTFYHLAAVRDLIAHDTALPKEVFFPTPVPSPDPTTGAWHLAVAMISNLSGQDPVMVWRVMTVALAPLIVLGFFTLALSITRRGGAALIACALYLVLGLSFDFRNVANPNQFGDVLAWLALAFALRFVDSGSMRELLVAAPIAFAASAVHGALSPFLLVALTGGVLAAIVVRAPSWRRFAIAGVVVGAAAAPLLIVDASTLAASAPYAAMAIPSPLPLPLIHHPWTWVWPSNWYDNPGTVLGTAFAVSLVRIWRSGEAGAALVIAAVLVIPASAITPFFATSYSRQYLLARVSFVLQPLAWVAWGWGLALAMNALRGRMKVPATAVCVVSAVAMAFAFYIGPLARYAAPASSLRSYAYSRSTDLTAAWRDRLAAIDKLPRSAVILAEPRMAYEIAGLTGRDVVAVPLTHTPAQIQVRDGPMRRADALDAVQGRLDAASLAGVIEHYGVTDVLVDMDRTGPEAWAQLAGARILSPIASGTRWRLYRYDPSMLDSYLALPTQSGSSPKLERVGVGPRVALAGRAVFARVLWQDHAGVSRLQANATNSTRTFGRVVDLGPAGTSETLALPIPSDAVAGQYQLSLILGGGGSLLLGQFDVGRLYQAEDMGGVVAGNSSAWTILGGSTYEGSLAAAATNPLSATRQTIQPVEAGNYCLGARVYDDGAGRANVIEITLGDASAQVSWSGSAVGTRWVRTAVALDRTGGQLGMRLIERGQAAVIVDALEFYPLVEGECNSD